jgi:mRNA interferase RelE/StbE
MYKVELSRPALKSLEDIPKSDQVKIGKKIDGLETNPRPHKVEKLAGQDNLYRIRSGDYRILYKIFDSLLVVLVVTIGNRKEVYRDL